MEDDCENSLPRGTPIIPATRSSNPKQRGNNIDLSEI